MRPRKAALRAPTTPSVAVHPGAYVRDEVLKPKKISVTDAAKVIGISRPGVSNFLNGNVAATTDMAARIERAFNIPAQKILEMQSTFDAAQVKEKGAPANTKAFVPPYLAIKASQISEWVEHNIAARSRLSVFLRTLVHSTGVGLTQVVFPGNDDAERAGWDGFIDADEGTPWIPAGKSGWEFGVNQEPKAKADSDFAKSLRALTKDERNDITFIFVTPRNWPGKDAWVKKAREGNQWKDVRAYDASDLEQWLEQSLSAQAWFANETRIPADDVRSLDQCWSDWADVASPALTPALFKTAIDASQRKLVNRLQKAPDAPIVIAADSTEEALAFLAAAMSADSAPDLHKYRDRVLVFDKEHVLPRLALGKQSFIPVAVTREVERELAPLVHEMHCFVVYPRNAANLEPDIVLEPAHFEPFRAGLDAMGKDRQEITRLEKISGRSLTVLRRQLSKLPALKTPAWAANADVAASLIPFLLVGAWNAKNAADRNALSLLANRPYPDLEKDCQKLTLLNDAPVWSIGTFRGVISKIDLLYAIAAVMTPEFLRDYFSLAKLILSEDDPALDLEEKERWAAAIHKKVREFSGTFREGICETLVLLAVQGNGLFKNRIGIDCELEAAQVVRALLLPLTTRKLQANDRDLPTYAEAAPDAFLTIIEDDLKTDAPQVLGLLKPVESGLFGGGSSRTGLLWALENLAWNPATLPRVVRILGRLSQVELNDNLVNKPTHSLESIFRDWMPQTAANHEQRLAAIDLLKDGFLDVAWKVITAQFSSHHTIGDYSHKPRWRSDGYGYGEPFKTWGPILEFRNAMVEKALSWPEHTLRTVSDLIARLHDLGILNEKYPDRVWKLAHEWAANATDEEKAELRDKIRVSVLSRRGVKRAERDKMMALTKAGRTFYDSLIPKDVVNKNKWLFKDTWVEESADELYGIEELDFAKRDQRIRDARIAALKEVFDALGVEGVVKLALSGNAAWAVGLTVVGNVLTQKQLVELLSITLPHVLREAENAALYRNLSAGLLAAIADEKMRGEVVQEAMKDLPPLEKAKVLLLCPFRRSTWLIVDTLNDEAQNHYWGEVGPDWLHNAEDENTEAVQRLLKAGRPRAAFTCVRYHPERVDAKVLYELLAEAAKEGNDKPGQYQFEQYNLEQAFKAISTSTELTLEQKAGLELTYLEALAKPWSARESFGIPNLEKYIEENPMQFVHAVVWAYKRKDRAKDPEEWTLPEKNRENAARVGFKLLEGLERIPGHDPADGELKADRLARWIRTVRDKCGELSRLNIADLAIGKLLSCAPIGADGVWPCEPVREVMEDLQSESMMDGAHTGLYNARGVHWRGEGGTQERELAAKYRRWAEALQFSHPFVSAKLLMGMVKTYEYEANQHDTEAGIRQRLG